MPYNSQALQFIYFKHTAYWVLVYSKSRAIITKIDFRTFSSPPPKEALYALALPYPEMDTEDTCLTLTLTPG